MPFRRKSTTIPSINGTIKLPKQQSTCKPILCRNAISERASISSIIPCGKDGADPTIYCLDLQYHDSSFRNCLFHHLRINLAIFVDRNNYELNIEIS